MATDEHVMAEQIYLGAEVERFLASPIGKYMVDAIESRRERAINDFSTVVPTDAGAVMRVQMELRMADQFQQWLADILIAAQEAARLVEQQSFTD